MRAVRSFLVLAAVTGAVLATAGAAQAQPPATSQPSAQTQPAQAQSPAQAYCPVQADYVLSINGVQHHYVAEPGPTDGPCPHWVEVPATLPSSPAQPS